MFNVEFNFKKISYLKIEFIIVLNLELFLLLQSLYTAYKSEPQNNPISQTHHTNTKT